MTTSVRGDGTVFCASAEPAGIAEISAGVEALLEQAGCTMRAQAQLLVALDEILSNIVRYAYADGGEMRVTVKFSGNIVKITFADSGAAYDPLSHNDPDTSLSAAERNIGGLGILLVKKSMDDVKYARLDNQNMLTITKTIK